MSKVAIQDAWKPLVVSKPDVWDRAKVRHLFRRACFGFTNRELEAAVGQSPEDVVQGLLKPNEQDGFESEIETMAKAILANGDSRRLSAWWLYRMLHSPFQLREKATLFWHGHFATSADKVEKAQTMFEQNQVLRSNALGKFENMVQQISKDPAMLIYLDSTDNRRTHPNENYARELLELFCLGLGSYTEKDIQQVARCFTGWQVRRDVFRFNRYQHDQGEKSFFGKRGNFGGDDAVRIVLQQPAAARFIATKLYRFFVSDDPNAPKEVIESLAKHLRDSNFDIGKTIQVILKSRWFYSPNSIGQKVKSPVELAIGLMRQLGCSHNLNEIANELNQIGQLPLYPPNVKGWDGGTEWINSSTMLGRSNLVKRILSSNQTKWTGQGLVGWVKQLNGSTNRSKVERMVEELVPVAISEETQATLHDFAKPLNLNRHEDIADVVHAISLLPEYQLN